jgi:esterase/lipase
VKTVLYLHGFASSPDGRKVSALREVLGRRGFEVNAPDLNLPSFRRLDFDAMVHSSAREAKRHQPSVIVGSSLGAVVALGVARGAGSAPLVLIAPAVGFGRRWIEKLPPGDPLPFFHHARESHQPIHRRFFEQMAGVEDDRDPPVAPVAVIIGNRDESVPFEHVREHWHAWERSGRLAPGSRFVEIPGGDHGLVDHVPTIAAEIIRLAEETPA